VANAVAAAVAAVAEAAAEIAPMVKKPIQFGLAGVAMIYGKPRTGTALVDAFMVTRTIPGIPVMVITNDLTKPD
jgi:hypothetical protein